MVTELVALGAQQDWTVLAQGVQNVAPEAPPGSEGFLRLLRWVMWGVLLAGVGALIYAGGKFGWEKYNGGQLESPKIVVGALIGGVIATSAGTIMNTVILS